MQSDFWLFESWSFRRKNAMLLAPVFALWIRIQKMRHEICALHVGSKSVMDLFLFLYRLFCGYLFGSPGQQQR